MIFEQPCLPVGRETECEISNAGCITYHNDFNDCGCSNDQGPSMTLMTSAVHDLFLAVQ